MRNNYLKDIEGAFESLSKALDSIDAAVDSGQKIHPSIGNRIVTAKQIVEEVMTSIVQNQEQQVPSKAEQQSCNTKISYLYCDAENNKLRNECVVAGTFSEEQKSEILSCLDEGKYFIPQLVGMPEEKFEEVDDPSLDHQWFQFFSDGFEETSRRPDVDITADELTAAFRKCKDCWIELYTLDIGMASYTPEWTPRSAVVGIDSARSAYTVREYKTKDEYFKDYPLMTSVFEDKADAVREAKRICKLLNVPYVDPDRKHCLSDQIQAAASKAEKNSPDRSTLTVEHGH